MCTTFTKDTPNNQKVENATEEVEKYFPGFWLSRIVHKTTDTERPIDKNRRRKLYYSLGKKKRHIVKNQLTVNKDGFILHKVVHKKGRKHDYIFNI
jgi:hypothetical protein